MSRSIRLAIPKFQENKIFDVVIVAMIIGAVLIGGNNYYVVKSLIAPAEFEVTDLFILPEEAGPNEPVTLQVVVTNVGEADGSYFANLTINGVIEETKQVELLAEATTPITFTVYKEESGIYSVQIGNLTGTFNITSTPAPKPIFTVTNLVISPDVVGIDESISVSAKVSNIGDEAGSYFANLTIDGVVEGTEIVELLAGESKLVEFTFIGTNEGIYSVQIADLSDTFEVTVVPPPPRPAEFKILDLTISPSEVEVGNPVNITVTIRNVGEESGSYSLVFKINDVVSDTHVGELAGGETTTDQISVTETSQGEHTVNVAVNGDSLSETFQIVAPSKYELKIITAPGGIPFTINGVKYKTNYVELLDAGTYTIEMPERWETLTNDGYIAIYQWVKWSDGETSPERTINLDSKLLLVVNYLKIACCPSLYIWNGTSYVYRAEISAGTGYLPYFVSFGEGGTRVFGYSDPWDYIKVDGSQLQPRNDYYEITLAEKSDEIFYIDSVELMVVDHSPDVDVYSTMGTRKYNLEDKGTIYTVSKNPLTPLSAFYEGADVLPEVSEYDGNYTPRPSDWEYQYQWDTLELNLGDLSDAEEIKLLVAGIVIWPPAEVTYPWVSKFVNRTGEPIFPVQYMEVKDENGNWVRVPDNRQFPMLDVVPDIFVVDLTGLFPTNDYSLRINSFFDWRFDYVGVDTTPQNDLITQEIDPVDASYYQVFGTNSTATGNFTRYGDVTELVLEADDKFVIGRQGDEVRIRFPTDIEPVPEGMERDYFVIVTCWFKSPGLPYLVYTVDPLPFHDMSCFPYPPTESYPYDEDHLKYLREYNTREIP